jgi:hypothetical protein
MVIANSKDWKDKNEEISIECYVTVYFYFVKIPVYSRSWNICQYSD